MPDIPVVSVRGVGRVESFQWKFVIEKENGWRKKKLRRG